MFSPLRNPAYRRLFTAQVAALLGTGMATVALGLLAHKLAGASAGEVLGAVLTIKMIAYIGVAPFASAIAAHIPRKTLLVALDVIRAGVACCLPFAGEGWQIYGLMAVLYVSSAAFTPAFQALIPDLLEDEAEYTKALSLSRLAADLESVASPVLAAVLLSFISYNQLFVGTALGFMVSGLFVLSARLPARSVANTQPFLKRVTNGLKIFALTPRLRGLVAISLATAAGGAMVFVNTVVLVQSNFGLSQQHTAWALAAFGGGSMTAALTLPRLLDRIPDRLAMIGGGVVMTAVLVAGALLARSYPVLIGLWVIMGFGYSLTITPSGRLLRRSSTAEDRPALFAAQFALSHACWLVAYPVAGIVSAQANPSSAFLVLAGLCGVGAVLAFLIWPASDPDQVAHSHPGMAHDDPHLASHGPEHSHPFVIDERHRRWPTTKE